MRTGYQDKQRMTHFLKRLVLAACLAIFAASFTLRTFRAQDARQLLVAHAASFRKSGLGFGLSSVMPQDIILFWPLRRASSRFLARKANASGKFPMPTHSAP